MPRSIIDTESSRPRYVRRLALTALVAVLLTALLLFALFSVLAAHRPSRSVGLLSRNVLGRACILATDHVKENPCCVA